MQLKTLKLENPEDVNLILGQSHFIKTVEDLHECLVNEVPGIKFGLAFCESSGPCLVRKSGNDKALVELAAKNALQLACGHAFVILLKHAYPLNILRAVKAVPEVCTIYCATANEVEVIVGESKLGRGILGVIDGEASKGIESEADAKERKEFLRKIGYKVD